MDIYLRSHRLSVTQLQFADLGFVSYQILYAILRRHVQVNQIKIYHVVRSAGAEGKRRFRFYLFQTVALDAVGVQPHDPAALPLGIRPGTQCTGGLVGHRAGMDSC